MHTRIIAAVLMAFAAALPIAFGEAHARRAPREIKWNNPKGANARGVEHASFKSQAMGVEVGYNVFLPEGYAESDTRCGVIYFLHGAGGDENSDAGGFSSLLSKSIADKKIPPVICVFPNGGMSGYRDAAGGGAKVETMIVEELIPLVDGKYRTIAKRDSRVVAGFSMGGGGAVRLALKHANLFSAAASWAGAFRDGEAPELEVEHLKTLAGRMRLLLVVGDQDFTLKGFQPIRKTLDEAELPYTYKELKDVGHNLGKYFELTGEQFVSFLTPDMKNPEHD